MHDVTSRDMVHCCLSERSRMLLCPACYWMGLDGIVGNWMEMDGIGWNWMELDGIGWYWMELDGIELFQITIEC